MQIILKNTYRVLSKYKGKTKFDFWTQIEPEKLLTIKCFVKGMSRGMSGLYATNIHFYYQDSHFVCSMSQAANYLSKLELDEVGD